MLKHMLFYHNESLCIRSESAVIQSIQNSFLPPAPASRYYAFVAEKQVQTRTRSSAIRHANESMRIFFIGDFSGIIMGFIGFHVLYNV